ncbi:phage tail terminator-like protein [Enterovirga rhinocerotis]|uniref:Uncharacterized protein DUF4128 n=1 Tax=Enterovirga rhinocerotis TaxID=1339210 RepID=A0A4R7BTN2_9HYPH|nr:phage tail terminator-like protein [Enterovirga rhinocerotis]TDR89108.1 uncharacterized protein DUF4128 [Enterovirga rhinocerotis]
MARKAVVDAVAGHLAANWTRCPIIGPNETGDADPAGGPFLSVEYPVATESQISTGAPGANIWREEGVFRLLLHVERNAGVDLILTWADELAALFRGRRLAEHIQCWAVMSPRLDDDSDERGYYQSVIAVGYEADLFA